MLGLESPLMEKCEEEPVRPRRTSKGPESRVQPNCVLTVGTQSLAGVLDDESETNVSVLIQGPPLFWVEEGGLLQTSIAEVPIRVCNILREEAEEDDLSSGTQVFRVGLALLGRAEGP